MVTRETALVAKGPEFRKRIKRVQKLLKSRSESAAMLIESAPLVTKSYDLKYPFRQDSSFFYLTGCFEPNLALLIEATGQPVLMRRKLTKREVVFDGGASSVSEVVSRLGCDYQVEWNLGDALWDGLFGTDVFYFQNRGGSLGAELVRRLLKQEIPSYNLPREFIFAETLIEPLRSYKSPFEIKRIESSIELTISALETNRHHLRPGGSELELALALEHFFKSKGGDAAFDTIVAAGPSAATLHYIDYARGFKTGDCVLVDWGAVLDGYAGDLTRVFPVSGRFEGVYREIYQVVLKAQQAAIAAIKPGVSMGRVQAAAVEVLAEGLKTLKVLTGTRRKIVESESYRDFFPHGIGHGLGIDVHDPLRNEAATKRGGHRLTSGLVLEPGMVITVEPGLYFAKRTGGIPKGGVRIEDDVLVTKTGHRVLSDRLPKEIDQVEAWLAG